MCTNNIEKPIYPNLNCTEHSVNLFCGSTNFDYFYAGCRLSTERCIQTPSPKKLRRCFSSVTQYVARQFITFSLQRRLYWGNTQSTSFSTYTSFHDEILFVARFWFAVWNCAKPRLSSCVRNMNIHWRGCHKQNQKNLGPEQRLTKTSRSASARS